MSWKNRRDSLDDFKEDRPLIKAKQKQAPPSNPKATTENVTTSSANVENNLTRNCAICNVALTEARYAEHFTACMKQRAAKAAAAAKAAKLGNMRPITDFISVKPSPSSKSATAAKAPDDQPSTSSTSASSSSSSSAALDIVLPYCPVCGRVIKTDRSYAPHLKQCAKKYNVAPDLLLELSKKQMTLHVEPPPSAAASSSKPVSGKKRPAKFFEMPSSVEDEQLQLAVALSASVIETHVSHLPIVSIPENAEGPAKRLKRQASIDFMVPPRDPAEAQIRLLELINERLKSETVERRVFSSNFPNLQSSSRLFHLACSSPATLSEAIKSSDKLLEMPLEFHIETCDFDVSIDTADKVIVQTKSDSPKSEIKETENESQTQAQIQDSTLQIAGNFEQDTCIISSTLAPDTTVQPNSLDHSMQTDEVIQPQVEEKSALDQSMQTDEVILEQKSPDRLSSNMLRLLNEKATTDVQFLSSDGSLIGAHRLILFAHCPGLISRRQFSSSTSETNARLSAHSSEFILAFLEFVYAGVKHVDFGQEIEEVFQSFQSENRLTEEDEEKATSLEIMSKSIIFAIANDASPQIQGGLAPSSETPALPSRAPDSPIVLSESTSPVNVYYDASSPKTEPIFESCSSSNDNCDLPVISPDNNAIDLDTQPQKQEVEDLDTQPQKQEVEDLDTQPQKQEEEEEDVPQPVSANNEDVDEPPVAPLDDVWMDFDNPDYNYCCFSSEVPLSQQQMGVITEQENDLIAEFNQMKQTEVVITKEENDLIAEFDQIKQQEVVLATENSPVSRPKLTVAGKSRPRVSIVGLTSVAKKNQTPCTPAASAIPQRTTPPFSQMATPNLIKLISKYGIRKLPKKHMVLKLKEIHSMLRPKQETVKSEQPTAGASSVVQKPKQTKEVEKKKPVHWKDRKKFESSSSSSEEENQEEESDDEAEVTIEPNALSYLDDIEDEDEEDLDEGVAVFFSQSQSVTASQTAAKKAKKTAKVPKIVCKSPEEFAEKVAAFIRSDHELYNDLLQYKPLPFKDIYTKVRKVGNFACSKQQLVDCLDEQCITFRLTPGKSHRPPPPPPVEKKPKRSKKQASANS